MLNGTGFNAQTYLEQFAQHFEAALGANNDIDLRSLCAHQPQAKGSAYWAKSIRPKISLDETTGTYREQLPKSRNLKGDINARAAEGTISRREWENMEASLKTFENDKARQTPHQDVDFYQTLIEPILNDTGHEFETEDELLEACDPTSATIMLLVSAFKRSRNMQMIAALKAASTTRKMLDLASASGTFGQIVNKTVDWNSTAYKNNFITTANQGYFSLKDDAPLVRAALDAAGVSDKTRVPCLINPHDFAQTCINSFDKWADIPYVTKQDVENGTMPDAFGLSFIKCNEIPKGKMYAWLPQAIAYVPWKPLEQKLGEDPRYKFHPTFYAKEAQGFARIDDLGVVEITVKAA